MSQKRCCFCGTTEGLHSYGKIDEHYAVMANQPQAQHACDVCDPKPMTADDLLQLRGQLAAMGETSQATSWLQGRLA